MTDERMMMIEEENKAAARKKKVELVCFNKSFCRQE